ncbi:MAG: hypothetical protein B9S32_03730 [Verrucomicrobia bacterium Tous-C9LFEB]|nr:MAG: hypothetical protein B9S32_03730 [Verrucomicrobia bacterium Tous-C9LFEB]
MGNRAVITFDPNPTGDSLGVYLHWNGGPESVYAFLDTLDHYVVRDNSDAPYQLARFVQIVGNFLGGTLSLGVGHLRQLDCDNGDNGLYAVTRISKERIVRRSDGSLTEWWSEFRVESERVSAYKHPYHTAADSIAKAIHEKNDAAFKES